MRRLSRTLLAYLLFASLFFGVACAGLATGSSAQEQPKQAADKKNDEKKDEKPEDTQIPAPPVADRQPQGPDELFKPLPTEGLFEGSVPTSDLKAVVLRVPNVDSWHDVPDQDLSGSEQAIAAGFELTLDQSLEYLPQVNLERGNARVKRYYAMLRNSDAPRVGATVTLGQKSEALEAAARTFNTGLVFTLSFKPGEGEAATLGQAVRYRAGAGVERVVEWEFGKLAKPEPDSMVRLAQQKIAELTTGIGAVPGDDGKLVEVSHAPIPRLVAADRALRDFQKLRDGLATGELTQALISYESIMQRDPNCGRAALFGMEVYRALSQEQSDPAEHERYRSHAIEIGREALVHNPNDVLIRGRLCWNAATHYNRFDFAFEGLKQAMRVQPACMELLEWWVTVLGTEPIQTQAKWVIENVLPKVKDGRAELLLANIYYGGGDYAKGVEWYSKGIEIAPLEFELQFGLGLCGFYEALRLARMSAKREANVAFAVSAEATQACQDIDVQEAGWSYEYYMRSATREFTWLPSSPTELERLFLVQAAMTGLEPTSRTWQWERLVDDVLEVQKRELREVCRKTKPGDDLYGMKMLARLQFQLTDKDTDGLIRSLWIMRNEGLRPKLYNDLMYQFGPLVEDYEPPDDE